MALECLPSPLLPLPCNEGDSVLSVVLRADSLHKRGKQLPQIHPLPIASLPDLCENGQFQIVLLHFCTENTFLSQSR